jgi:peptidyl-prolyl cis-trans isomerase D
MLQAMRKHAKYFYVLFVIIIITFVFWGVGTVDKTGSVEVIAEVGQHKITVEEYWKAYDRTFRFYKEVYKDTFNEKMQKDLKEKVLDSLMDEKVLLIASKEAGISVSDEELQDSISGERAFLKNGVFDKDVYINRLRLNRITPEVFENMKRQELTYEKMRRLVELSVDATALDIQLPRPSGNEQAADMIRQAMMGDKKGKAVKSFIEGYKKSLKIKINKKLIE